MTKSVGSILLLLAFVQSFTWADEAAHTRDVQELRWNTPPELMPESVVKMSGNGEPQARLLSLIPVTATLSLNAGHNNAHSVSLGASLDGISLSESNSYNRPAGYGTDGSSVSVSKSTTLSAGLSGVSTADAQAYSKGNNAKTESHSLSFGQASAISFGAVENGQAISGAASSVGISQSSAATGGIQGQSVSQAGAASVQYANRPIWNNIGPNNERNDRYLNRPTLTVSKPFGGTRPVTWNIDNTPRREQRPTIRIYKWRPNQRVPHRPSISIEHHEFRPHDSWNGPTRGSPGLQVGISSSGSSSYGFSASNSASQDNASPLSSGSSDYIFGGSFVDGDRKGTSGYRGGSSVAQVNVQAGGNGYAEGIASQNKISKPRQTDSDIFSDFAHAVGELLDVV